MNEADFLPYTIESLSNQSVQHQILWVCVNQPDHWWEDPDKVSICENNKRTLTYLSSLNMPGLVMIDKSSPGLGWSEKAFGVGQARKTIMDQINKHADPDDLLVSLDADTRIDRHYLEDVEKVFRKNPQAVALSNPYYHELTDDEQLDRAMLRYEIYMRHYAINMWRIGSPYSFTALGSAMALPIRSYRKVGGMTPKKSGEDFYFLQKLRKAGWVCCDNQSRVYPATRYSDRVFFGTGPALIKGSNGDWSSYPVYDHGLFDQIRQTYHLIPDLFKRDTETPLSPFLREQFGQEDPFAPLRQNASSLKQFSRAFHEKLDGLRLLQYLKRANVSDTRSDEERLAAFLSAIYPGMLEKYFPGWDVNMLRSISFMESPIVLLNKMRNLLMDVETTYQKMDKP